MSTAVIACRMPVDEIRAVEKAAAVAGESVSEYVREAISLRLEGQAPFQTEVNFTVGSSYMQVDHRATWVRPSGIVEPGSYPQTITLAL